MSDLSDTKMHLVDSVETAMEFKRWLGDRHANNTIAVDTETTGLNAFGPGDNVRLIQLGDTDSGWAIPWDDWRGVALEALNQFEGEWVYHNLAFDARFIETHSPYKIPWHRVHDTMLAAQIIDPTQSAALKTLTARLIDNRAGVLQSQLDEDMTKNGWDWRSVPVRFPRYWQYAALDVVLTSRIYDKFRPQVCASGEFAKTYELEMAVRAVCSRMEMAGARVDLDYCQRKFDELNTYSESVKKWAKDKYDFALGSNVQLVRKLKELGATITSYTKSGQPSADADQLKLLTNTMPGTEAGDLAHQALLMRKAGKLSGTYFAGFLRQNTDGLVHPNIRTMGARTGRMSCNEPNLQNLGKSDSTVRHAFIPRTEDERIITSDLDQVEFRLVAAMSQDPQLIGLFKRCDAEGGDAFTEIMREVYREPAATKVDKRRGLIKSHIYARLYGAGIAKQALTAGVPVSQMQAVADGFDARYPGVKVFQQRVEDAAVRRLRETGRAFVHTSTGRKLYADNDRSTYKLVNYLIQSTAAEIFKMNLIRIDQAGLGQYLMAPVHDEAVMSVPKDEVDEVKKIVKECMTTEGGWSVPLTAGCEGPFRTWGEAIE